MYSSFNPPSLQALNPVSRASQPSSGYSSKTAAISFPRQPHLRAINQTAAVNDLLPRDISSRFGLRLRELRRSRNMTQLRMAVDFGIDRSFISDVERGKKSISLTFLEVIALGLKLELSDLVRGL
jgi:DNA-binding XRE family transcriptional regulator